jgi:chromosome segregation ATPase
MPYLWVDRSEWDYLVAMTTRIDRNVKKLLAQSPDLSGWEEAMAEAHKSLDEILTNIRELKSPIAGMVELVKGLQGKLEDALANVDLPAEAQDKIDAIFDEVEQRKQEIQDAIDANTSKPPVDPNAPPTTPPQQPPPVDPNAPQVNPLNR